MKTVNTEPTSGTQGSHVLLVTGPAGAGKTEATHYIKGHLSAALPGLSIFFISGDVFSHISFPWSATESQLDIKYACLGLVLERLLTTAGVVVIDDVFRRNQDRELIEKFVRQSGAKMTTVCLDADLASVLVRNSKRTGFQKAPEAHIQGVHKQFYTLDWSRACHIDATRTIEEVVDDVVDIFLKRH